MLQKVATEIGAKNLMTDSGASFSCCVVTVVRSRASARKTGARISHRIYGANFWSVCQGLKSTGVTVRVVLMTMIDLYDET